MTAPGPPGHLARGFPRCPQVAMSLGRRWAGPDPGGEVPILLSMHVHIYIYRYVYIILTHSLYIYIHVSWPQSSFGVRLTPGPSLGEAVSSGSLGWGGGGIGTGLLTQTGRGRRRDSTGPQRGALGRGSRPHMYSLLCLGLRILQLPLPGWESGLGQGSWVPFLHLCTLSREVG